MFRINKLTLYSYDNMEYTYKFSQGLNYIKGKNDSGKTEFYKFLDYMFGSSEEIRKKPWYKDTLKKASLEIEVNNIVYILTRSDDPNINYISYIDDVENECITQKGYKDKLNSIFTKNTQLLKDIREFTQEELTYRTFTMFNFLGEQRQGNIQDFFDKCSDIRYSIKLVPILNFIFNNNLKKIHSLQSRLKQLQQKLKDLETLSSKNDFICNQVNNNIQKLGFNICYNGKNVDTLKKNIEEFKNMGESNQKYSATNISDLEVRYSNISEQIKIYENTISDARQINKDNSNRKILLNNLQKLLYENEIFAYLVEPLKQLIKELDSTISFTQYTINDKTISELKKQRKKLKQDIKQNDSRFQFYTMEEKAKSIALIEEYLSVGIHDCSEELSEIKKEIRGIKEELKVLQNLDDTKKIQELSEFITMLYKSAKGVSSVVNDDVSKEGFKIQYFKQGNILQPMIKVNDKYGSKIEENQEVNYYIGSMARHTLIQLCGYLGFLKIILSEDKYPIIPILAIDHISKPFDTNNACAIGQVINEAYKKIGKENLQIFMFDNKECTTLALQPDHIENLVNDKKSGFNPFYNLGLEKEK